MVYRATDRASSVLGLAFAEASDRWRERPGDLTVPTLVVHGTDEPFYRYGNGQASAGQISGPARTRRTAEVTNFPPAPRSTPCRRSSRPIPCSEGLDPPYRLA